MPHIVTENCQSCRFTDCISHCPVECFDEVDEDISVEDLLKTLHGVMIACGAPLDCQNVKMIGVQ